MLAESINRSWGSDRDHFTTFQILMHVFWVFFFYLQGCEHEHLLLCAVYLLQQDGPAPLFVQLGYSNCVVLEQNKSTTQHCTIETSCPGVLFLGSVEQLRQVSHFWIQVKEDVVLEAEQQLVFMLDVLLHQGAG